MLGHFMRNDNRIHTLPFRAGWTRWDRQRADHSTDCETALRHVLGGHEDPEPLHKAMTFNFTDFI